MYDFKHFKNLTFENLVLDSSFRDWVYGIGNEGIVDWHKLQNEDAVSAEAMLRAKQFLLEMKNQILSLPANEVETEVQKLLAAIGNEQPSILSTYPRRSKFFKIASVAAILVVTAGVIFYSLQSAASSEVLSKITKRGERARLQLADGSTVLMNVDSRVNYPEFFGEDNRTVELHGEAVFYVNRNEAKPFIVKTGDFKVQVLGTSFNVSTYSNDSLASVELLSGAVMVKLNDKEKSIVALRPFEKMIYDKTTLQWRIEKFENENVIGWKDGVLVFDNTPLEEIIKELERSFDVTISVAKYNGEKHEYTGRFKTGNLDKILEGLCFTWGASYEISGKSIVIRFHK